MATCVCANACGHAGTSADTGTHATPVKTKACIVALPSLVRTRCDEMLARLLFLSYVTLSLAEVWYESYDAATNRK